MSAPRVTTELDKNRSLRLMLSGGANCTLFSRSPWEEASVRRWHESLAEKRAQTSIMTDPRDGVYAVVYTTARGARPLSDAPSRCLIDERFVELTPAALSFDRAIARQRALEERVRSLEALVSDLLDLRTFMASGSVAEASPAGDERVVPWQSVLSTLRQASESLGWQTEWVAGGTRTAFARVRESEIDHALQHLADLREKLGSLFAPELQSVLILDLDIVEGPDEATTTAAVT